MGSMNTFEALVGCRAEFKSRLSIVAFLNREIGHLPLAECTVTLKDGELFIVTGQAETGYFTDLEDALWFAHNHGADSKPGAIAILTPCRSENAIPVWQVSQVHERAVAKV